MTDSPGSPESLSEPSMSDPRRVAGQYATTHRLATRSSVWQDTPDGRNPREAAIGAIRDAAPRVVVDLGCGTGEVARRIADELPGALVLGIDQSSAMVSATLARGVAAVVGTATALPLPDDSVDVVYAGWMLYHVADLDAALTEVRRVLRPSGRFVAATNGDQHLADLLALVGERPQVTGFSSENGAESLGRHFAHVAREDFDTRAVFPDHGSACAYLASYDARLSQRLEHFDGARTFHGAVTVFTAH